MTKNLIISITIVVLSLISIIGCGKSEKSETPQKTEPSIQIASLQAKLDTKKAESANYFPDSILTIFADAQDQIANSGVIESTLKKGARAPDFELPNANGDMVKLSSLLKDGPVILTWYRGGWCPNCNIQLNAITK